MSKKIKIKKFAPTEARVEKALIFDATLRDDDDKLLGAFFYNDMKNMGLDPHSMSYFDFHHLLVSGKLTPHWTIRRARQRVQERVPETRGNKWNERHKTELEVRKEIAK
jgi:hypothetical protein